MTSKLVAVLIASPRTPLIDDALLARAVTAIAGADPRVLAPGFAAEFAVEGDAAETRSALRAALAGAAVDIAVLPAEGRRKRLLVADMDSTLIEQECLDELAGAQGLKDKIAPITERAMRGEIAFEPALRKRVAMLAGLDAAAAVGALLRDVITYTPGGRTLVATMHAHGAYAALVSGGFTSFTGPVAETLGFDEHHANVLEIEHGRLTGRVAEPVLGRDAKVERLRAIAAELGISETAAIAVGDGANDLGMLAAAGLGVAFRARPAVAEAADVRIDHGDLTALLYLQGYAADDFVTV